MKAWKWFAVVAAAGMLLGTGSVAYAQGEGPATGCGLGPGRGGPRAQVGTGLLHDYMVEALAERLGLAPEAIEQKLAAGDTMAEIALSEGLTVEAFRSLWLEVRQQAIAEALADGVLTPEQADWLSQTGPSSAAGMPAEGRGLGAALRHGLAARGRTSQL